MSNETMINPINNSNSTVINSELQPNNATVINTEISNLSNIAEGTTLCDKYTVVSKLDINTGEADLYVCDYNSEKFIAKIYRRKFAVKPEVTNILKQIDSPYIAKLYETGTINGMPFEILPYYKNGSIQGRKFTFDELKNNIIPCINAGLKALHDKEIIHKDLKPSNIMLCDNGKDVAIIDFGISSVRESGNTVVMTRTGMTPEYSAPETFRSLFLAESDYYSLGVTVFELFCGYTPYAHMSSDEIEKYTSVQRIPVPKDMPTELADFINALTYYDITNRKNKDNPNRRWTYEEVRNWCAGKKQTIPGEGVGNSRVDMKPYNFNGKDFTDVHSLIIELATHWNDGKKELFRGYLAPHFANSSNQKCARVCDDAEEEARKGAKSDDLIFWATIYKLAPELKTFYWKGKSFENLPALGRSMLEKLWKNDKSDYAFYESILSEKLLTQYVELRVANNQELKNAAKNIEAMHTVDGKSNAEKTYYMMAYMLSGQKIFNFDGKQFRTVGELAEHMKGLLNESYDVFQEFCHKLIDYKDNLDVQFECWLIALGKSDELKKWKESLRA